MVDGGWKTLEVNEMKNFRERFGLYSSAGGLLGKLRESACFIQMDRMD
jgi:hypothetical protein